LKKIGCQCEIDTDNDWYNLCDNRVWQNETAAELAKIRNVKNDFLQLGIIDTLLVGILF